MTTGTKNLITAVIDAAEEFPDLLEGLIGRVSNDPGAPFVPDVLEDLSALKRENRAAFEVLRAKLKNAGCRMTALDEAMAEESGATGGREPSQADTLISLAATAYLFHTPDGTGYADLEINGHRETWPIRSTGFKDWLVHKYYCETGGAPSNEALNSARGTIQARARFDGPESDVNIRVAECDCKLYIDLADDNWRAVEIDEDGWRIIEEPPVRFRRAAGMLPLHTPIAGGSIELLRPFLNVGCDYDFVLVVAWILMALRNKGPYPVIVLAGEQGTAKSTFSSILRALLDPNTAPLRALSREDRELFIAATNGHVLTFDNVSRLPGWISDTLARLATGGGFAVRQLYTDQDEVLFDAARPIVLNGIEDFVTRPDLADRAIFLKLEPIPEGRRRSEKELWAAFDKACPKILGALLDAVSLGLSQLPDTKLAELPRMADFALWATACEAALWDEGTFWKAYTGNRDEAVDNIIEADPVGSAVRSLMASRTVWTGTATELLDALSEQVSEAVRRAKAWPATPRGLSGKVRRAATFLRKLGIDISFEKEGRAKTRIIRIVCEPDHAATGPSAPPPPSAILKKLRFGDGVGGELTWAEDGNGETTDCATDIEIPGEFEIADGADDADANNSLRSEGWRKRI
jgi:hypothetical protein